MLTAIDFNDEALFEANEVENKALKRNLPTKFETREPPVAERSPHGHFSVGRFPTHLLRKIADALGGRPMVWRLRREPLTRRLTSFGATLSHKRRGKIGGRLARNCHTRIGIST